MKKTLFLSALCTALCGQVFGAVTYETGLSDIVTDTTITIGTSSDSFLTSGNQTIKFDVTPHQLVSWTMTFETAFSAGGKNYSMNGNSGGSISIEGSLDDHLAIYNQKQSDGTYMMGIATSANQNKDNLLVTGTIARADQMTLSYDSATKIMTLSNGADSVTLNCTDYNKADTILKSGTTRIWTNGGHAPTNIVSVSGQYERIVSLTLEDGEKKTYSGEIELLTVGRADAIHSDTGASAYVVDGTSQLWFAATGSDPADVTIAADLYLQSTGSSAPDNKGALRVDTSSGHTLTFTGNVNLGQDTVISSHKNNDGNFGAVVFSGKVSGEHALTILPRAGWSNGAPVSFTNTVDVTDLTVGLTANFADLTTGSLTTEGGNAGDKVVVTVDNLTLNGSNDITLGGTSSLVLGNEALTVNSLTLGVGTEITLNSHAGVLTTSALNVGGDTSINANLVVAAGSTLTFTSGTVTLGCSVTFGANTTIALGTAYEESLIANDKVLLFTDVESYVGLENVTVTGNFSAGHLITEAYTVEGVTKYNIFATPEPATASLSMLALAGLMARRRRR